MVFSEMREVMVGQAVVVGSPMEAYRRERTVEKAVGEVKVRRVPVYDSALSSISKRVGKGAFEVAFCCKGRRGGGPEEVESNVCYGTWELGVENLLDG